jgi:hypothetical protein
VFTLINLVCIELSKFESQNNLETSVKYISMHRFKQLGLVVSLSMGVLAAHAQTPAAAPPPAWKQGMSDAMATSTLAPLAGKLTATKAADVPIEKIKLPPGFKVEVWADSVPGSRVIAQGDGGKYYVGTRTLGRVY